MNFRSHLLLFTSAPNPGLDAERRQVFLDSPRTRARKSSNDNTALTLGLKVRLKLIQKTTSGSFLKFIAVQPESPVMKSLFYTLILVFLISLNVDLHAQLTSSLVQRVSSSTYTDDTFDAPTVAISQRELSKRERQRFQRSLVRRGDDLAQWDQELENRELKLNGRGARGSRALSRDPLPARLLNSEDLYAWETRLDKLAARLRTKDLLLQEREIRLLRTQRLRQRSGHGGHLQGCAPVHNPDRCVEACCRPQRN